VPTNLVCLRVRKATIRTEAKVVGRWHLRDERIGEPVRQTDTRRPVVPNFGNWKDAESTLRRSAPSAYLTACRVRTDSLCSKLGP